ncbi:MAG: polyprenyl synthetase family protein [Paludibacteraceae bacterium]|jgi:geranylgeranyl diphosphate synthase type II|nr:polyprenyl synthetase family protein [Paludibacteraceae bacterium]
MIPFNEIIQIINAELNKLDWDKKPEGLYRPIAYVLSLGGKRIRPSLVLMACNLFSDEVESAIAPALGIEIFHNFTLLHDDIMDKAELRRGHPTVHKKWDENTAILSGDLMQIAAYQLISQTKESNLKNVLDVFSRTAAEVCEGQQYDMDFEDRENVSPEEYLEMIRLKTAVLLGASLKIGAIVGNASNRNANLLYDFGINLGMAFQLKDDLLDVYGDEQFGKEIGGDIVANKKTYLLISAQKLAEGTDAKELNKWLKTDGENKEKVKVITTLYNRLGVKNICENKMQEYFEKSIDCLNQVSVEEDKKKELRLLAEQLMFRKE